MTDWIIIKVPTEEAFNMSMYILKKEGYTNNAIEWSLNCFKNNKGILYCTGSKTLACDNGQYFKENNYRFKERIVSIVPEDMFVL